MTKKEIFNLWKSSKDFKYFDDTQQTKQFGRTLHFRDF